MARDLDALRQQIEARRHGHLDYLLSYRQVEFDRTVSPADGMFAGDESSYFAAGLSALHNIDAALLAAGRAPATIGRILDLPCGHGRVLRFLRSLFPGGEIVGCDLDHDGVDFCAETFGATPVYSDADVSRIDLPGRFDLIWVGSLFTHLDAPDWRAFLTLFASALAPRGVLVFTVAGTLIAELIRAGELGGVSNDAAAGLLATWDDDGFGFACYEGVDNPSYGRTVVRPTWVIEELRSLPNVRLVTYGERAWDCRQDVVAVISEPGHDAIRTSE